MSELVEGLDDIDKGDWLACRGREMGEPERGVDRGVSVAEWYIWSSMFELV